MNTETEQFLSHGGNTDGTRMRVRVNPNLSRVSSVTERRLPCAQSVIPPCPIGVSSVFHPWPMNRFGLARFSPSQSCHV